VAGAASYVGDLFSSDNPHALESEPRSDFALLADSAVHRDSSDQSGDDGGLAKLSDQREPWRSLLCSAGFREGRVGAGPCFVGDDAVGLEWVLRVAPLDRPTVNAVSDDAHGVASRQRQLPSGISYEREVDTGFGHISEEAANKFRFARLLEQTPTRLHVPARKASTPCASLDSFSVPPGPCLQCSSFFLC